MKIVSCYRASVIAQVSKQLMSSHKKTNQADKSRYPYFAYDKDTGKFGVDLESQAWKLYMESRQLVIEHRVSGKKNTVKLTDEKITKGQQDNRVYFKNLMKVTVMALDDVFKPSKRKRDDFLIKLAEYYEALEE